MKPLKPDVSFDILDQLDLRVARVVSAPLTVGTRFPCREVTLDLGPFGRRIAIGQYALLAESELVGRLVVACCNLGVRRMGGYVSAALVLGVPHPDNPPGQAQALPLYAHTDASPGDAIY